MKLVDEKGRLFGLINALDLLMFFVIAGILYGLVTSFDVFTKKKRIAFTMVELRVKFPDTLDEIVKAIKVGDVTRGYIAQEKATISKILNIEDRNKPKQTDSIFEKPMVVFFLKEGDVVKTDTIKAPSQSQIHSDSLISKPSFKVSDIELLLKTNCETKGKGKYYFSRNDLKLGSKFIFKTDLYDIQGIVLEIKDENINAN